MDNSWIEKARKQFWATKKEVMAVNHKFIELLTRDEFSKAILSNLPKHTEVVDNPLPTMAELNRLYELLQLSYKELEQKYIELVEKKEVVLPVDIDLVEDIMEDVHNQSCIIKGDRAYIDLNTLKMILAENISKITTPVEPINQERLREIKEKYQLRLERNRKERDKTSIEGVSEILTKEFVEDLQSLQSESEVVHGEKDLEYHKFDCMCNICKEIRK